MTTIVSDADAEAMIDLFIGADVHFSLHTANPGKAGANLADITSAAFVSYLSTDWAAAVADAPSGGRLVDNTAAISFGNATADETVSWVGVWDGAFGVGTLKAAGELVVAKALTIGEPVSIPIGDLDWVGSGAP